MRLEEMRTGGRTEMCLETPPRAVVVVVAAAAVGVAVGHW